METQLLVLRRYQESIHVKMAGAGCVSLVYDALASQHWVFVGHDVFNIYVED